MRKWSYEQKATPAGLQSWIVRDGWPQAYVLPPIDENAESIAQSIVDALNKKERREAWQGPWGDPGAFCQYCGQFRGAHHTRCNAAVPPPEDR